MSDSDAVAFPPGLTGSALLRQALAEARTSFAPTFDDVDVPNAKRFKRTFGDVLVAFEARRVASPQRVAIARWLTDHLQQQVRFGARPLAEAVREPASPGAAHVLQGTAVPGWRPRIPYGGRTWELSELSELADRLRAEHQLTAAAADALRWVAGAFSGAIDLTGQRFAVLGAQAELAPTPYLLEAGARVLWVDRAAPEHLDPSAIAGTVVHYPQALDLLTQAPAIRAAIALEAEQGAPHLGLYAYAPGRGRELLLTAAMNAIAEAVEPASVSMLVSPTTPGEVQPEDRTDRAARAARAPAWQRTLRGLGALGGEAAHAHQGAEICRSIVPLQGTTYLAAQYLTKMMVAEAWVIDRAPMRMSANVAGITHTRSLEHPLFLAGFQGARAFGIRVFDPEQTRVLMALLMLHDVLRPDAPAAQADGGENGQASRLAAQTVHGGLRSAPFELEATIRVAALLGLAQRPGLLWGLLR